MSVRSGSVSGVGPRGCGRTGNLVRHRLVVEFVDQLEGVDRGRGQVVVVVRLLLVGRNVLGS